MSRSAPERHEQVSAGTCSNQQPTTNNQQPTPRGLGGQSAGGPSLTALLCQLHWFFPLLQYVAINPCICQLHWFFPLLQYVAINPCTCQLHWFFLLLQYVAINPCICQLHWFFLLLQYVAINPCVPPSFTGSFSYCFISQSIRVSHLLKTAQMACWK